jgi:hypothetical protein
VSEVAGTLITEALRRVRDESALAHSRDDVRAMLDKCQKIVNAFTKQVYDTETVTTTPQQQVYSLAVIAPNAIDVKDVKEGNRSLPRTPWRTLFYTNREWTREVASRTEVFAQLGVDLLILHPSEPIAGSVSVTSVRETADLVDENAATEIVDDDLPAVLDLTEAVLTLRHRYFGPFEDALKRCAVHAVADRRKV